MKSNESMMDDTPPARGSTSSVLAAAVVASAFVAVATYWLARTRAAGRVLSVAELRERCAHAAAACESRLTFHG